jgi:hypothetical protein
MRLLRLTCAPQAQPALAHCRVTLNRDGTLAAYETTLYPGDVAEAALPEENQFDLWAYVETMPASPWFNNQRYLDTLNPAALDAFLNSTHEWYAKEFSGDFGGLIPAIFTDEPQHYPKGAVADPWSTEDLLLPWTRDFPKTYAQAYGGENILESLPELRWNLQDRASCIRYQYHDHVAERFAAAFSDRCGAWCEAHGLMLTGHLMAEATLESQTVYVGDAMRGLRGFQLPGIDMLCDAREFTTAKQAQSVARQYGRPGVMSELYGVTNWDFDFRGHKLAGDWQAALGVTVRVPHLSWVSMAGEAKRDYPATFNYQVPWYEEYSLLEDHFARVALAMTQGKPVVRVGVLHPVESMWLHWGPRAQTAARRRQLDENFQNVTDWLLRAQLDFDFISEALLPTLCPKKKITSEKFPVGEMAYDVIVCPGCETLRATTVQLLTLFRQRGGWVLFMGPAPRYVDGTLFRWGKNLWRASQRVPFQRQALLEALAPLRQVSLSPEGDGWLHQLRETEDSLWLFLAKADPQARKHGVRGEELAVTLAGEYAVTLYDTLRGYGEAQDSIRGLGRTTVKVRCWDQDSLLLRFWKFKPGWEARPMARGGLTPLPGLPDPARPVWESLPPLPGRVPVTLSEPNALLLDMPEYALDQGAYRPAEEVLRLDTLLRTELGWPLRTGRAAQPWVEKDETTPHTLRLRFYVTCEEETAGTELALEKAAQAEILLNGRAVTAVAARPQGWYVDKAIERVALPVLQKGRNCLEVALPFGRKTDVEAMYLLGDFGVQVAGREACLTGPVRELAFGDITRQGLPFYGGNVTYHLPSVTLPGEGCSIVASGYAGALLTVASDGEQLGQIVLSPYRLDLDLPPGPHVLDITCFGTRVNTFGQVHKVDRQHPIWWGPDSWRTTGEDWTYEYRLWEQGILKAPELFYDTSQRE